MSRLGAAETLGGWSTTSRLVASCSPGPLAPLPEESASVSVNWSMSHGEWRVAGRNKPGSTSDMILAPDGQRRSNIYPAPSHQVVVIRAGRRSAFLLFTWRPLLKGTHRRQGTAARHEVGTVVVHGVIEGEIFRRTVAEGIALLGEGRSPNRREYQRHSFC